MNGAVESRECRVDLGPGQVRLAATLLRPLRPHGLVLVAHGSGSDRFSPRNRRVAGRLLRDGLATVLLDLLTPAEAARDARDGSLRFAIPLLGERLVGSLDWVRRQADLADLPLGLFGASTGAAAALTAAAVRAPWVGAVVCRGGRPDLAPAALALVRCPVLLIVGERDPEVLRLNRWAAARLRAPHRISLVPGASHLFEEPGTLERVAEQAADWFSRHLTPLQATGTSHSHTQI